MVGPEEPPAANTAVETAGYQQTGGASVDCYQGRGRPQSDLVRTVELEHSPTVMEYEGTIPSRYMVGTSQGNILCCSRKAKTQKETILSKYSGAHYSSVRAVQRNTIFPKSFLSAGDWSIKVGLSLTSINPPLCCRCGVRT